jgi:carbon storage regulator
MLILTRKQGQAVSIGENITVVLVAIDGDEVRIGIEAPRSVAILRDNAKDRQGPTFLGHDVTADPT